MPLYTYVCPRGHETEALVKLDESNAPVYCKHTHGEMLVPADNHSVHYPCNKELTKKMSVNAKCFPGADSWQK